jgi:hypothetical protein
MREDDCDRVSRQGREAWQRLKKEKNWNDWIKVGEALQVGRELAMHQAGTNQPIGSAYNMAFGKWLAQYKLNDMDKGDRARLFTVMGDLPQIEEWRRTLSLTERLKLNHPNAVLRKFKAHTSPKAEPRPDAKPARTPPLKPMTEAELRTLSAIKPASEVFASRERANAATEAEQLESEAGHADKIAALKAEIAALKANAGKPGFANTAEGLLAGIKALYPLTDRHVAWPETSKADAVRKKLFGALGAALALLQTPAPPRPGVQARKTPRPAPHVVEEC